MGFSNSMRNCGRDNLIYKAVCFNIEDHFVINEKKREQLLGFSGLMRTICNCQTYKSMEGC